MLENQNQKDESRSLDLKTKPCLSKDSCKGCYFESSCIDFNQNEQIVDGLIIHCGCEQIIFIKS